MRHICSYSPLVTELFRAEIGCHPTATILQELDDRSALCDWPEDFTSYYCLHRFPVLSHHKFGSLELDEVGAWVPPIDLGVLEGKDYSFQLSANRRLPWSLGDLLKTWTQSFRLPQERMNKRRPECIVSAYFLYRDQNLEVYLGVSTPVYNRSPWSRGECRIPFSKSSVSRAEQKLLEVMELASVPTGGVALDLGAAPGGWTRVLTEHGLTVHAVDPAELDQRVASSPKVEHFKTTAGDFLDNTDGRYQVIVCDMKMAAPRACKLMLDFADRLQREGMVILTLKLPKGTGALDTVRESIAILEEQYEILMARQLYFNRREITVAVERKRALK